MSFYWYIFVILLLLSILDYKKTFKINSNIYIILFISLFIIFIIGFRYDSVDYKGYEEHYQLIHPSHIGFPLYLMHESGSEFLFSSMLIVFKYFELPFYFFIFAFSMISLSIKFAFFKKYSPYFYLSLLLFFAFSVHKDLGQIRSAMIASLMLLGILFMIKRNIFYFSFIILVAFCIQFFALVALPLYWAYPFLKNNKTIFYILILGIVIFLLGGVVHHLEPFLSSYDLYIFRKIIRYIHNPEYGKALIVNINMLSLLFFALLLFLNKEKYIPKGSFYEGLYVTYMYGLFSYLIFSDISTISGRAIDLFVYLPLVILIPYCISKIEHLYIRSIFFYLIILFATIRFIPTSQSMAKYQNIFLIINP